jgi:Cys-rich four helix bundle protein (predicted Tat secretion target)
MNRREVLVGAGALALAAVAKAAPKDKSAETQKRGSGMQPLIDASADCLKKGEACESHCFTMLGGGDASMAACAMAVRDMLASARAVMTLASAGSKHTRAVAKARADICKDCEVECRKHAQHPPCHDCAEACAACSKRSPSCQRKHEVIASLPAT